MKTTVVTDAEKYRAKLNEMMNVYLERGGEITYLPTGLSKYDAEIRNKAWDAKYLHDDHMRLKKRSWIRKQWGYKGYAR